MTDTNVRIVLCTVDTNEAAQRLAHGLIEERLAACVNIVPGLTSVFPWHGAVQTDQELLLIAKTTVSTYPELERRLRAEHPYDVPEILALPVAAGLSEYLNWVEESTDRPS